MAITMKKYIIKMNDKTYEVEMGEVPNGETVLAAAPSAQPKAEGPAAPMGGEIMKAPMPGTILDLRVTAGQRVERGQVLLVLEAMKMENEIVAPCGGVIGRISVAKGQNVNVGDVFLSIE